MDLLDLITVSDLRMLQHLDTPIWVFDLNQHAIWWGNPAAVAFWKVDDLDALKVLDFSRDSETSRLRLRQIALDTGASKSSRSNWTIYPAGNPVTVVVNCRGVMTGPKSPAVLIEAIDWQDADIETNDTRLQEAVSYAGVMISMFSMSGKLLVQNAAAFGVYGRPPKDATESELERRITTSGAVERLADQVGKSVAFDEELDVSTLKGPRIHRFRGHPGKDPSSGKAVIIVSEDDVTDLISHKRLLREQNVGLESTVAEGVEQLRISEERFSLAMRGTNDGVWDQDLETKNLYLSPGWLRILGLEEADEPPNLSTIWSLVHPDDLDNVARVLEGATSGEHSALEMELRMRHRDGRWIDILSRAFVVVKDGRVVRMVGTHVDITERKRSERRLHRLKEILFEGSEALPVGVAYFDSNLKLVMNSSLYKAMLPRSGHLMERGVPFLDIVRNSADVMAPQHGFDIQEDYVQERLRAAREGTRSWVFEQRNGRTITAREIPTTGNGIISILEDITDERSTQKRLQQAHKMEAIGQLTGGIAHDFNNMLAVIMGNLELLQFELRAVSADSTEFDPLIEAAIEAVRHGADLTGSMLSYARKARLAPAMTNLNDTVRRTERWMRRTIETSIDIETVLQGGIWHVKLDPGSLQSAIVNLILNARDAMDGRGRLTIETANVRIDESYVESRMETIPPGRYVMLAISDTGTGMEPETVEQIFDPFFTTKAVGKGTGLGLSMVEGFVRQSGGFVRVYSESGEGSSFKLYFAASKDEGAVSEAESIRPAAMTIANAESLRILLAEDRPEVMMVLEKILSNAGFNVTTAANGDIAYSIFKADPNFDLVLTDVVMPGLMQGPAFAKACRALRPDTPFIFLSGYASEATVHGNGLSPDDVRLMKPISRLDLLTAVQKRLSQNGRLTT